MAVLLHALLALVLIDLCFTAFLNRAHVVMRGWCSRKRLGNELVERILNNPLRPQILEVGDHVSDE
jgi:hypothetical protein